VKDTHETKVPLLFIDTAGCNFGEVLGVENESKANEAEVEIVVSYIQKLMNAGLKLK
jgi:superfamily I DNA and/or RNA helicase